MPKRELLDGRRSIRTDDQQLDLARRRMLVPGAVDDQADAAAAPRHGARKAAEAASLLGEPGEDDRSGRLSERAQLEGAIAPAPRTGTGLVGTSLVTTAPLLGADLDPGQRPLVIVHD